MLLPTRLLRAGCCVGNGDALSVLQRVPDVPRGPALAVRPRAHFHAAADQFVGGDVVLGFDDGQLGLGLPVERQIEIARKDLPARAVLEFDDAALGRARIFI